MAMKNELLELTVVRLKKRCGLVFLSCLQYL